MLEKLRVIFTIPELRQKILLTLGLLAIYRVGWQVPLPIIDANVMNQFSKEAGGIGELLRTVAVFSASQLSQATIVGLGQYNWVVMVVIVTLLGTDHPPIRDDGRPLGPGRTLLGLASFLIPIVTFMPEPLVID